VGSSGTPVLRRAALVIADIARHSRDRKPKALPLINADERGPRTEIENGNPGVESCKSLFFGDGLGEGGAIAGIADIARHRRDRKAKTLPLINADERGSRTEIENGNPGVESCKSLFFGDGLGEGGAIAGIADIARHRRNRKNKTLLLINADDTDQESRATAEGGCATRDSLGCER